MKMIEEGHGNLANFREISVHAAHTLQLIFFEQAKLRVEVAEVISTVYTTHEHTLLFNHA